MTSGRRGAGKTPVRSGSDPLRPPAPTVISQLQRVPESRAPSLKRRPSGAGRYWAAQRCARPGPQGLGGLVRRHDFDEPYGVPGTTQPIPGHMGYQLPDLLGVPRIAFGPHRRRNGCQLSARQRDHESGRTRERHAPASQPATTRPTDPTPTRSSPLIQVFGTNPRVTMKSARPVALPRPQPSFSTM